MTTASRTAATGGPRFRTDLVYTDRAEKARYIAEKYRTILGGSVLDVGCDARQLRALVARPERYVGVDLCAAADLRLDLDAEPLPFPDASFDTVVCCDVLEHLEHIHRVFDDLCRVSRAHVVISLPNAIKSLVQELYEGSNGAMKWYGLPVEPQKDRHRWFFGYEDAVRFVRTRGARAGFTLEQVDAESVDGYYWLNGQGRDVLGHPNVRLGTMWAVLTRGEGEGE